MSSTRVCLSYQISDVSDVFVITICQRWVQLLIQLTGCQQSWQNLWHQECQWRNLPKLFEVMYGKAVWLTASLDFSICFDVFQTLFCLCCNLRLESSSCSEVDFFHTQFLHRQLKEKVLQTILDTSCELSIKVTTSQLTKLRSTDSSSFHFTDTLLLLLYVCLKFNIFM